VCRRIGDWSYDLAALYKECRVSLSCQWSVLSVSLSCPTVFLFAFETVYYWTNKDGWILARLDTAQTGWRSQKGLSRLCDVEFSGTVCWELLD